MKRDKSILIVDDEQELGLYMQGLLEPYYNQVAYVGSASEAQQSLKMRSYSLVMSDIKMPGMQGHELVEFLRSIGRIEPVVFITGNATHDVLLSAVRLGVSDVIEKPFEEVLLLETIERVFEIEKRRTALFEDAGHVDPQNEQHKKKMIGLLQAVNSRKKGKVAV